MFSAVWRRWLRRGAIPSRRLHRFYPRLEQLEDRVVPSGTITIADIMVTQGGFGPAISGTLNPGDQAATYHLNGFAGERVSFHWVSGSIGQGSWTLYGPTGNNYLAGATFG